MSRSTQSSLPVALAGTACFLSLLQLSAQQPSTPPSDSVQFRAGVELVRLDVSVSDRDHRPIRGLKAEDFIVREDSNPQKIVAFSAVDIPDPPTDPVVSGKPVAWMREVASDVQSNAGAIDKPESRLFVLFIDDALIPFEPWIIANAKKIAASVIDKLAPNDRMAVVLSAGGHGAQGFTSDHARLRAAANEMEPGHAKFLFGWDTVPIKQALRNEQGTDNPIPFRQSDDDIGPRDWSFNTLRSIAETLMAIPERRKALIYVSPGIPVNPADAGVVTIAKVRDATVIHEANARLFAELPELFRRMQRAGVVVYSIDPSGLDGLNNFIQNRYVAENVKKDWGQTAVVSPSGLPVSDGSPGPWLPNPAAVGGFVSKLSLDFLLAASENTGGRAIVNTNDPELGIKSIFEENRSFYLIGYQAPSANKAGDLHRIDVKVNRKDATVRTRSGYYTPKPEKIDPRKPLATPAAKAVADLLPSAALPLRVALAAMAWPPSVPSPLPPPKKGKAPLPGATVAVVLGLERAALTKPIADTVDVQISAFTPDGVARGTSRQLAQVAIRPSTSDESVHYEALSHIELKPGRYELRIAAYSGMSDLTGSVFANVDVPDFAREPVSLSGVFVSMTPPLASAPRATLASFAPIVPTAERTFHKLDRATAWVRVYQGGSAPMAPVRWTTTLVNERDQRLVDATETLLADRFEAASRAAELRFELPTVTLGRGQYLLTFEATLGKTVSRRLVRFTVQ